MFIVQVFIHVKPERVEEFVEATLDNARHSVEEDGIVRFDVVRRSDDPTRFLLFEVYRDDTDAPARHKETAHYHRWRKAVAGMMAEDRYSLKYESVFPVDEGRDNESLPNEL